MMNMQKKYVMMRLKYVLKIYESFYIELFT